MFLKNKKIFVTGGHGFVGTAFIKNLIARGISPTHIFSPTQKECNLLDSHAAERAVRGKDIVVHIAAVTGNSEFHKTHPAKVLYENALMGLNLFEAARKEKVEKMLVIASAAMYSVTIKPPFREADLWKNFDPATIHAPYNFAKFLLIMASRAYRAEHKLEVISLVPTNMYGPGDTGKTGYVIPSLITRILRAKEEGKQEIEVWGTGRATRDFLYVDDAASGMIAAIEKYNKPDPINLGSGREVSIRELVAILTALLKFSGRVRWIAEKKNDQKRRVLDIRQAQKEFGFRPRTTLEAGLKKTVEWYLTHVYKKREVG